VFGLFSQNLNNSRNARGSTDSSGTVSMTLDILVLLLPYLSTQDASELFDAILSEEVLVNPDNAVQKRAYKILSRLVQGGKLPIDAEQLFKRLDELSDGLSAAAKKVIIPISANLECNSHGLYATQDRLQLYANLLPSIPPSALHVIPLLIPEAVLGTKEPSEKARGAAFELIIAMGRKMAEGGVVKRSLVDGMEEDGVGEGVNLFFLISLLYI
jgi:ribosomal RNA-processing protein 12